MVLTSSARMDRALPELIVTSCVARGVPELSPVTITLPILALSCALVPRFVTLTLKSVSRIVMKCVPLSYVAIRLHNVMALTVRHFATPSRNTVTVVHVWRGAACALPMKEQSAAQRPIISVRANEATKKMRKANVNQEVPLTTLPTLRAQRDPALLSTTTY